MYVFVNVLDAILTGGWLFLTICGYITQHCTTKDIDFDPLGKGLGQMIGDKLSSSGRYIRTRFREMNTPRQYYSPIHNERTPLLTDENIQGNNDYGYDGVTRQPIRRQNFSSFQPTNELPTPQPYSSLSPYSSQSSTDSASQPPNVKVI